MERIKNIFDLSLAIAKAEFKLRNEGSYLGVFWYLLDPLFMFLLLLGVFSQKLGGDIPAYPLYLLLGIILFNFFQKTTQESTRVIYENRWIIKSINFPRYTLPLAIILKNFFSHILEIALLAVFFLFFGVPLSGILFYPLVLVLMLFFVTGVAMVLSAFTVYIIDLENVWIFVARLLWFGTPIFYQLNRQDPLFWVNLLNPMYYFITMAREIVIYTRMPAPWLIMGALVYSGLFFMAGFFIFNKLQSTFAEKV